MNKNTGLLPLFLIFIKIGAILLGGGYVILPIMQDEFVKKRKFIREDELINYYALSQSLPGIVAANMTMFVGYKLKGKLGAFAAMLGVIFVPFLCIVILASVLRLIINNPYIQGAMWGIGIAVIALIFLTTKEMWQKAKRDLFFYIIFLSSLTALMIFRLSPIQTILIFTFAGIITKAFLKKEVNK